MQLAADAKKDDGEIARDAVAPKAGLALAVTSDYAGRGAEQWVGVDDASGEATENVGVGLGNVELAKNDLAVGPCKFEDAVGQVTVVVFFNQPSDAFLRVRDTGNEVDADGFVGLDHDGVADGDDGIEDCAFRIRKVSAVHGGGIDEGSTAANELGAVGLIGGGADRSGVDGH